MAEKRNPFGLIGLLFVLALLVVALVVDRQGRADAEAAAARVAKLLGVTEEEAQARPRKSVELQDGTASRDQVEAAVGKKPLAPLTPAGNQQYETYSFGSLRSYPLFVYYTMGKKPVLVRYSLYRKA